jgi:putative nucleotidyltransferase with HDIG domain
MMLATLAISLVAGMAAFAWFAWGDDEFQIRHSIATALVAAAASLVTGIGLYPVLRRRDELLFRAVMAVTSGNYELLAVLGKLTELRGGDTAGHNLRVACYALLFAEALDLPPDGIVRSVKGALLHDLGKLAVPDRLLAKPQPLTGSEQAEMAAHVGRGVEVVLQSHFLADAVPIVSAHHEHYDGSGYPHGLAGEEIPREARMFALIDVFDALTSQRVYKRAYSVAKALKIMAKGRGSRFDPGLFDRFMDIAPALAERLPAGEDGQRAMLMRRMHPYVDRALLVQLLPKPAGRS